MGRLLLLTGAAGALLLVAAGCGGSETGGSSGGSAPGDSPSASPSPFPCPSFSPRIAASPGAFQPPVVSGTVTSTGSGTVTVRDRTTGAEVLVTYGASTSIRAGGGPSASGGSPPPQEGAPVGIKAGDFVSVQGAREADSSVAATAIMVRAGGAPGPGRRFGCRPSPLPG